MTSQCLPGKSQVSIAGVSICSGVIICRNTWRAGRVVQLDEVGVL